MNRNAYIAAAVAVAAGFVVMAAAAVPAFAAGNAEHGRWNGPEGRGQAMGAPVVFGTVTAVNGATLTVTETARPGISTTTAAKVYAVNADNAKIYKGGATSTVSVASIAVGDTVMVEGTVSGTTVTATAIHDGVGRPIFARDASSTERGTPPIQGNGQPVVAGAVTAVNGTTITITNASNVTYTIDAASTTIVKDGTSTTIGSVASGDSLVVQGAVNGTSVTASSIIDQGTKASAASAPHGNGFSFGGVFGAIGGFFRHVFGF